MKVAARTSASPDAEASIFDDVGHPVPADLVNAYLVHKGTVDRVLKDLRDLKQSVHSFYEGYETWERLSKSAFDSHHGNLRRVIEHINPYAVCPYCSGDGGIGSKCKGCQGVGWVNKVTYEGAPEDLK
jgi:hypothetical protein